MVDCSLVAEHTWTRGKVPSQRANRPKTRYCTQLPLTVVLSDCITNQAKFPSSGQETSENNSPEDSGRN